MVTFPGYLIRLRAGIMTPTAWTNPGSWTRATLRNSSATRGSWARECSPPSKKPQGGKLLDWQKEFNKQINKIRYVIEQVIANFKTWRIMHTDYRRPIETFTETISAVI